MSDEIEIMRECQSGRADRFGIIYEKYFEKIFRYLYYRTYRRDTAEDITSTVFLKALANIKTYDSQKGGPGPWLFRIAHNALVDYYRSLRPEQSLETIWDLEDNSDLIDSTEARLTLGKVKSLLTKLSPKQKNIVIMRVWDDLSYAEIAAALNMSEAACRMGFSRALRKLTAGVLSFVSIIIAGIIHSYL